MWIYNICNIYNITNVIFVIYSPTTPNHVIWLTGNGTNLGSYPPSSFLCKLRKLWTWTSYLTSLCLRIAPVKQERWRSDQLGWDSTHHVPFCRFSLLGTRERLQGWRRAEGGTDCFLSFPLARLSPSCPPSMSLAWLLHPGSCRSFLQQQLNAAWNFSNACSTGLIRALPSETPAPRSNSWPQSPDA